MTARESAFLDSASRVLRRLNGRTLLLAHAVGALWFVMPLIWTMNNRNPPATFVYSVAVITELTVVFVLLAILVADEAVRRGVRRGVAYPCALVVAALGTAVSQWYVRGWLGFQTFVNRPGVDPVRQVGQLLNMAVEIVLYGGLVMLIYVSRRRDLELETAAREAELGRARSERALMEMRLATALAEVNPAELLARLRGIHEVFATESSLADRALYELIVELRERLGTDASRGEMLAEVVKA